MRLLISIVILFVVGCGDEPQTIIEPLKEHCENNKEIKKLKDKKVCIESVICYKSSIPTIYSYGCFCDQLCLCFISKLEQCSSIVEKKCKHTSHLLILPVETCELNDVLGYLIEFAKRIEDIE